MALTSSGRETPEKLREIWTLMQEGQSAHTGGLTHFIQKLGWSEPRPQCPASAGPLPGFQAPEGPTSGPGLARAMPWLEKRPWEGRLGAWDTPTLQIRPWAVTWERGGGAAR